MWLREKKKKLRILIGFHSANKIDYNRVGRKETKSKNIYRASQNSDRVTAVRVLTLSGSHSPPHLPRTPSNTVLISAPAMGAAQDLIWAVSPVSTATRAIVFSFVGALNGLLYIPHTESA